MRWLQLWSIWRSQLTMYAGNSGFLCVTAVDGTKRRRGGHQSAHGHYGRGSWKILEILSHWPSWCRGREDVMRSGPWVESKETHEPCLQTQNKQTGLEGWGKQNNIWKCMERTVWRPTWGLFLWNVFSVWLTGIRKWRGILSKVQKVSV